MDAPNLHNTLPPNEEEEIDLLGLFFHYLAYWKWFVLSVALCVSVAYVYLRLATPIYTVSARILLVEDKKVGLDPEMAAFEKMGLMPNGDNVNNQVEVLRTVDLMIDVVRTLGIYVQYFGQERYKESEYYGLESPIYLRLENAQVDSLLQPFECFVTFEKGGKGARFWRENNGSSFELRVGSLPGYVKLPLGRVFVGLNSVRALYTGTVRIVVSPPLRIARSLLGRLTVNPVKTTPAVVNIGLELPSPSKGKAILSSLLDIYNDMTSVEKNRIAFNTGLFIEDRVSKLGVELSAEEQKVQTFLQTNSLTDVGSEASLFLQQTGVYEQKRLELETQLNLAEYISEYLLKPENRYSLVPTNLGINDAVLVTSINGYNKVLMERERLQRSSSPSNPAFVRMDEQVTVWRENILEGLRNVQKSWQIARSDMMRQDALNEARLKSVPQQSRKFVELSRQQQIKEALYVFLLQKREETNLSMAAIAPNAKFIEQPLQGTSPISPNRKMVLAVACMLGLILPIGVVFGIDTLKTTLEHKDEFLKLTDIPILGEIPLNKSESDLVVTEFGVDSVNEMFRSLRANLIFVMSEPGTKVITVTSGMGGEGKTFICLNLAMSFALMDKKVCLVGLDIRKPKLAQYLHLEVAKGITHYLAGQEVTPQDLCLPSGVHPNLSIIVAGATPPNPSELLNRQRLDELFAYLREHYDIVLVDTAPIGPVSDTLLLNRVTDLNLYIFRANQTPKNSLDLVNNLHSNKQLKKVYLVLNAVNIYKKRYGYGYGKKYGYGYGYGYGEPDAGNRKGKKNNKG